MQLSIHGYICLVLFITFTCIESHGSESCDESITLISNDARYLVFDTSTLEIINVGNLWYQGILEISSIIEGSDQNNIAIAPIQYIDPKTGKNYGADLWEQGGIVILRNIGTYLNNDETQSSFSIFPSSQDESYNLRWLEGGEGRERLILYTQRNEEATVALLDEGLNNIQKWAVPPNLVGSLRSVCRTSPTEILISGPTTRVRLSGDGGIEIDKIFGSDEFTVTKDADDCIAMMSKVDDQDDHRMIKRIIDVSTNAILSEFSANRYTSSLLFNDYTKLLEQDLRLVRVENTSGSTLMPTNNLRTLNTTTGEVLRELPVDFNASLHNKLYCKGKEERVVFKGINEIYLLDPNTLELIKKTKIPFNHYFVL